MLSPDGQCKTFDSAANGYVPGEGIGVLLLQRLEDAIKDGNYIYGVIKGTAVNHGGKTLSITAPRVESQMDVILTAYEDAELSPETTTYVEAHGTGTSLGDPIEIEALTQAFRNYTQDIQYCRIGSVKTNIGHLEAAAGVAGVIKVLLMLKHRQVPPSLNIKTLNPMIPFDQSPFLVARELTEWEPRETGLPLRAGLSSFGMGGVNSHIILEEFPKNGPRPQKRAKYSQLFIISAKSRKSLTGGIEQWKEFVQTKEFSEYRLDEVCATLMTGRSIFSHRFGCQVKTIKELRSALENAVPYHAKESEKKWCLRVGKFLLDGYTQVQPIINQENIFKNLDHVNKYLHSLNAIPRVEEEFRQKKWPEPLRPIFSFMVGYAFLNTVMNLGFAPQTITGERDGIWLSLAISGIIRLEDALGAIFDPQRIERIVFSRPKIPFYDPLTEKTFMPYLFDEAYIRFLVDELSIQQTLFGQILAAKQLSESARNYIDDFYLHSADLSSASLIPSLMDDTDFAELVREIVSTQKEVKQTPQRMALEMRLGESLVNETYITTSQLEDALKEQEKTGDLLGSILLSKGYCTFEELIDASRQQHQETRLGLLLVRNKIVTEHQELGEG